MYNTENAKRIDYNTWNCVEMEDIDDKIRHSFFQIKVEVHVDKSLPIGFWWTNSTGDNHCVDMKYKRLSHVCYECGKHVHTSQSCTE